VSVLSNNVVIVVDDALVVVVVVVVVATAAVGFVVQDIFCDLIIIYNCYDVNVYVIVGD